MLVIALISEKLQEINILPSQGLAESCPWLSAGPRLLSPSKEVAPEN